MRFVPFTEDNDWEGETWTFWLQLDGNEEELVRLHEATHDLESYSLNLNVIENEDTVDHLERHAKQGYMSSDIVVTGKFVMPDLLSDDLDRALYKGGIEFMFKDIWQE